VLEHYFSEIFKSVVNPKKADESKRKKVVKAGNVKEIIVLKRQRKLKSLR
jgi:hypothetical protein